MATSPLAPSSLHHVLDADQLLEALRLQSCRIGPEIEHGVDRALLGALGEQRRSAEFLRGLGPEIEIGGAQRVSHDQEPALVERSAGDADLLALEIGQGLDRRIGRHHDRAERGGEGGESEVGAARALARHPQPIGGDDVDRAALQAHGRRLRARERDHFELDALGLVEAVLLDGVERPAHGAEFEDADLELVGGMSRLAESRAGKGANHESQ